MLKTCRMCSERKPLGEFYRDASRTDGRTPECASCRRQMNREDYAAHRQHRLAAVAVYHAQHRPQVVERKRKRYAAKKAEQEKAS